MDGITDRVGISRSPSKPLAEAPWLPLARRSPFLARALSVNFIQAHKDRDWFLRFACEMMTDSDTSQGKLFARLYCFFLDYLPRGLTGQFELVLGADIMAYMLDGFGETAPSKHRFYEHIWNTAWAGLDSWMRGSTHWEEALKRARVDSGLAEGNGETGPRGQASWKAPGLLPPAAVLALLAIVHPDKDGKMFRRINDLQISWMLQPRSTLSVQEGFWKGINSENLLTCFSACDNREAEVFLRADYSQLFGENFRRCRTDIRPFLPPWARSLDPPLSVQDSPEIDDDAGSDNSTRALDPVHQPLGVLRRLLTPECVNASGPDEWLEQQLSARASDVLRVWCNHWAQRLRAVANAEEQLIIRSLFQQSLGRLRNLYPPGSIPVITPEAYMLLDMEDCRKGQKLVVSTAALKLQKVAKFIACQDATSELARLTRANKTAGSLMLDVSFYKVGFYCEMMKNPLFTQHALDAMTFDELRTRALLQDLREHGMPQDEPWPEPKRDMAKLAQLQLTTWQQQMLLVPGQLHNVLTEQQQRIYFGVDQNKYAECGPTVPIRATPRTSDQTDKAIPHLLRDLFGTISLPGCSLPPTPLISPLTPTHRKQAACQARPSAPQPARASISESPNPTLLRPSPLRKDPPEVITIPDTDGLDTAGRAVAGSAPRSAEPLTHERNSGAGRSDLPVGQPQPHDLETRGSADEDFFSEMFMGRDGSPAVSVPAPAPLNPASQNTAEPADVEPTVTGEADEEDFFADFTDLESSHKRAGSCLGGRAPKRSKLSDMVGEEVKEDLRMDIKALKKGTKARIQATKKKLRARFHSDIDAAKGDVLGLVQDHASQVSRQLQEAIEGVLRQFSDKFDSASREINAHVHSTKAALDRLDLDNNRLRQDTKARVDGLAGLTDSRFLQMQDEVQAMRVRLAEAEQRAALKTEIGALRTAHDTSQQVARVEIEALRAAQESAQQSMGEAATQQAAMKTEIEALKSALEKAPGPGEDGYLSRHCPAPADWVDDQKTYESMCFRAATVYVSHLDMPSEGFNANKDAFLATKAAFPEVSQKHLTAALKHLHVLMYNRPFMRSEA